MLNFMDEIKNEQKKYGTGGGDYFKFESKGVYKIRILNQPKVLATHFFGKGNPAVVCKGIDEGCPYHGQEKDGTPIKRPSIKLVTYVIDRSDDKIKIAELPLSVSYSLNDLQQDEDFAFDSFPMPYDVKITYDPDNNDPKAIYRLVGSPKQEPLTKDEEAILKELMAKQTPEQYVEFRKGKKEVKEEPYDYKKAAYSDDQPNPEDVPF